MRLLMLSCNSTLTFRQRMMSHCQSQLESDEKRNSKTITMSSSSDSWLSQSKSHLLMFCRRSKRQKLGLTSTLRRHKIFKSTQLSQWTFTWRLKRHEKKLYLLAKGLTWANKLKWSGKVSTFKTKVSSMLSTRAWWSSDHTAWQVSPCPGRTKFAVFKPKSI